MSEICCNCCDCFNGNDILDAVEWIEHSKKQQNQCWLHSALPPYSPYPITNTAGTNSYARSTIHKPLIHLSPQNNYRTATQLPVAQTAHKLCMVT